MTLANVSSASARPLPKMKGLARKNPPTKSRSGGAPVIYTGKSSAGWRRNEARGDLVATVLQKANASEGPIDPEFWKSFTQALMEQEGDVTDPYSQSTAVYSAVTAISDQIGSVRLRIKAPEGEYIDLVEWEKMWRKPTPYTTYTQFWSTAIAWWLVRGECTIVLSGKGDNLASFEWPAECWPMNPAHFKPEVDEETKIIRRWKYTPPGSGRPEYFEPEEVLQLKCAGPGSLTRGCSPLMSAKSAMNSASKAAAFNEQFFDENAEPTGVLSYDGVLEENDKETARLTWDSRHKGKRRMAVLGAGWSYHPTQASHRDMEFFQQFSFTREQIIMIYKVPLPLMGIVEAVTYGPAMREVMKSFWKLNIIPKLRYISEIFTDKLGHLLPDGYAFEFDLSEVEFLKEDMKQQLDIAKSMQEVHVPLNVINEHLNLGLPNLPWGDVGWIPFNLQPVDGDPMEMMDDTQEEDTPSDTPVDDNDQNDDVADDVVEESGLAENSRFASLEDKQRYWERFVSTVLDPHEAALAKKVKGYMFRLRKYTLERLAEVFGKAVQVKMDLNDFDIYRILFRQDEWDEFLQDASRSIITATGFSATRDLSQEIGGLSAWSLQDPRVKEIAEQRLTLMSRAVNGTLGDDLKTLLLEGIDAQWTYEEYVQNIKEMFNSARSRARTIARTEIGSMANQTRFDIMQAEGITEHEWLDSHDEKVRPTHVALGKVGPVPIGHNFAEDIGAEGEILMPGDANGPAEEIINCRCVMVPIIKGDA